ncbi:hypothetical protein MWG07_11040 [Fusobacterium necrophorum]|uniref:Uncharacterized protein n=1 Tax=Fusobacterium necrophorum TaxID=859 RepID=A0AAW6WEB7_9FUSO|nr:hypothetical protein [Fusobacterium necrophorum]MDK4481904.1 hypothetical protein [Fusobacterium necrophorum]MDK4512783.1 hypothetical protein [Fusobacterium necrophorum]
MFKLKIVTDKRTKYELAREISLEDGRLGWECTLNILGREAVVGTAYEKEGKDWKLVSDNELTEKLIFLQVDDEIVIGGIKYGN